LFFLIISIAGEMRKNHSHFWLKFFEIILLIIAFLTAIFLIMAGTEQYWRKPRVEVKVESRSEIDPNDSVVFSFNQPVKPSEVEPELKLFPQADFKLWWNENNTELEVRPANYFEPGRNYTLELPVPDGLFRTRTKIQKFDFKVQDFPQVILVVPSKEERSISINSDFKITFDHSVHDFNTDFVIEPQKGFRWESDEGKETFRVFSQDKLDYETTYEMKIMAQPASNGSPAPVREVFSGTFQTEKKPEPKIIRSNSAVIPEEEVIDHEARVADGRYIDINLSKQHLSMFEESRRLGTYRISTGKRGMATPTGNFKILAKRGRAWSAKYKLYMPYFMQFTGVGHGIHELPEWLGGYKEGAAHLGIPVSHGCVRLGIGPAEKVYNFSDIGIPVVVHY